MASHSHSNSEEAIVFQSSSPACGYYVQSPSTTTITHPPSFLPDEASRATLSRYSSSRGSTNSITNNTTTTNASNAIIIIHHDDHDHGSNGDDDHGHLNHPACHVATKKLLSGAHHHHHHRRRQRLHVVGVSDGDGDGNGNGVWRYLSVDPSSSCCCIGFQVGWRLMASIGVALLVFFLLTKPPKPNVSIKVGPIKQFSLNEGLDNTGIVTKILSCNCSIKMEIENYSKVFGLHVHSSMLEMTFESLRFAISQGEKSYLESQGSLTQTLYVGIKNKPMYGAGRSMEDLLLSSQGLPMEIHVNFKTTYHVVGNFIKSTYHHYAMCQLLVNQSNDGRKLIQLHKSNCYIQIKKTR